MAGMHHYQCNECGYTWYTTLATNRCADPMCLKYNIRDLYVGPELRFDHRDQDRYESDAERIRDEGSRHLTEYLTKIIKLEEIKNEKEKD